MMTPLDKEAQRDIRLPGKAWENKPAFAFFSMELKNGRFDLQTAGSTGLELWNDRAVFLQG